jgi:hypothetical protein
MYLKLILASLVSIGLTVGCSGDKKEVVEVVKEKTMIKKKMTAEQPVIIEQPVVVEKETVIKTVNDMITKPAATITSGSVACTAGDDTRMIQINTGEGCQVMYTKFGTESQVANAANDMSYCNSVSEKIQSNLTAAGFTCADKL